MPRHHAVYICDQEPSYIFLQDIRRDPGVTLYGPKRCIAVLNKRYHPVALILLSRRCCPGVREAAIARAAYKMAE